MNQQLMFQGGILIVFIAIMYFVLIKPQKKREQEVENMRSSIKVGDHIVTIGGIIGKVVKAKEDSLVIQVGADKTKFEIMRWAVSNVESKAAQAAASVKEEEAEEPKKARPKRLGKKDDPIEEVVEVAKEGIPETVDLPNAEEAVEEAIDEALAAEESVESINK